MRMDSGVVTFFTFPTIIQVKKPSIERIRLRGSRRRGEDFSTSKTQDGVHSANRVEEIEEKEKESSSRRRKRRRARGGSADFRSRLLDSIPQPLIGESTSTPLSNSHDATLALIVVPLLFHCCQIISNLVTCYLLCFLFYRLSKVASPTFLLTLT